MGQDSLFEARLAEHMSARDELYGAISNQHLTLTFGTAAIVGAFAAGFVAWSDAVAPAVFVGILPLSWWILAMWLGEVVRMLRAVEFCTAQEKVINSSLGVAGSQTPALRWEQWRQEARAPWRTITWTYLSVGIMIAVTDLAGLACAAVTASHSHWAGWVVAPVGALIFGLGLFVLWWVFVTFQKWGVTKVGMPRTRLIGFLMDVPTRRSRESTQRDS
ncbi:MAG TPA: hypothetical protein VGI27_09250 [Solirubrobacteraceae bacterium]|jgi:hypothetical protein